MKKLFYTILALLICLFVFYFLLSGYDIDGLFGSNTNKGLPQVTNNVQTKKPSNKLSGMYRSNNGEYIIDFYNDGTLRWREIYEVPTMTFADGTTLPENKYHESFYEGTYEYSNGEYVLFVKGGGLAENTVFHAKLQQDNSLLINGGIVYNEYFRKTE